ncbi:MAG: aminotransferase class V-fold PLP-dependent enzyme [Tissierellia bacterium]|nr:aminotransferase class V-fold PLP-dependent enzyme [Tissierellia bacterium]
MVISFETLGKELVGKDYKFQTPYGRRLLTYADYTASGRSIKFIENYLLEIQKYYANTHTEDSMTGKVMTKILQKSEKTIKRHINAEKNCFLIPAGTGATGAIEYLAKILGIYLPPASKIIIDNIVKEYYKGSMGIDDIVKKSSDYLKDLPVVFIGPYEHHSNILIWEEGMAELVEIGLNSHGRIDIDDLKRKVADEKYKNRLKIGSFSAASNVTGIITPVYEIAKILHENKGIACFDFAAGAPYIEINMNKSNEEYFDAIYLAPHKFLGGPASAGILVINERIYHNDLPPTVSGGGTVSYVGPYSYDYIQKVELREMAGTPGIIQIIKAALVIELKELIGIDKIESQEKYYAKKLLHRLKSIENIEILGPEDENNRLPIFSFKIKHRDKYIHPKFVTKILNDLFGIQTRAGCACAAPYGHRLLDISEENSRIFRYFIKDGIASVRPGWVRFNIHYIMNEDEVDFICNAIEFLAQYGYLFLSEYVLDIKSGSWHHKSYKEEFAIVENFGVEESLKFIKGNSVNQKEEEISPVEEYERYLYQAKKQAEQLEKRDLDLKTLEEDECPSWFYYIHSQ